MRSCACFFVALLCLACAMPAWSQPAASDFYTMAPCRIFDTRGPSQQPLRSGGVTRIIPAFHNCALPPTATSVAVNVTAAAPTDLGHLTLWPSGTPKPQTSTVNFSVGKTRANNSIFLLSDLGELSAEAYLPSDEGRVHLIIDVTGYFQPERPTCLGKAISEPALEAAVSQALSGLIHPANKDFGAALSKVGTNLGCSLFEPEAPEDFFIPEQLPSAGCDSTFCPEVQYCGPGNSRTTPWLKDLQTGSCLNQTCFSHDRCYADSCVNSACSFSGKAHTAECDDPFFAVCSAGQCPDGTPLNEVDRAVCKIGELLQTLPAPSQCGYVPCVFGCDAGTGKCTGEQSLAPGSYCFSEIALKYQGGRSISYGHSGECGTTPRPWNRRHSVGTFDVSRYGQDDIVVTKCADGNWEVASHEWTSPEHGNCVGRASRFYSINRSGVLAGGYRYSNTCYRMWGEGWEYYDYWSEFDSAAFVIDLENEFAQGSHEKLFYNTARLSGDNGDCLYDNRDNAWSTWSDIIEPPAFCVNPPATACSGTVAGSEPATDTTPGSFLSPKSNRVRWRKHFPRGPGSILPFLWNLPFGLPGCRLIVETGVPMQSKVQRWGNSLAVRIPKPFANDVGLREDSPVEISVVDGGLVILPSAARPFSLRELLAEVTDENIHTEVSTGPALGNEAW